MLKYQYSLTLFNEALYFLAIDIKADERLPSVSIQYLVARVLNLIVLHSKNNGVYWPVHPRNLVILFLLSVFDIFVILISLLFDIIVI